MHIEPGACQDQWDWAVVGHTVSVTEDSHSKEWEEVCGVVLELGTEKDLDVGSEVGALHVGTM